MEKMTLEKLEYSTQHARDVEPELGKPLMLNNYVTENEGSSVYSDMKIAITPDGAIVVKSNWDKSVHLLNAASRVKGETRWSYPVGDAINQHLAVGSNGEIILKVYGRGHDDNKSADAGIYVVCIEQVAVGGQVAGKEKWRYLFSPKDAARPAENIRAPIITHDTVYLSYENNIDGHSCLCALDLHDGREKWNESYPGMFFSQPVLNRTNGFFVSYRQNDAQFNATYGILELSDKGKILGHIDTDSHHDRLSLFSLGSAGDLFALSGSLLSDGALTQLKLYKISQVGGVYQKMLLTQFPEDQQYRASDIIIGPDDILYLPTLSAQRPSPHTLSDTHWNSKLWAIDPQGKIRWQNDIYGYVVATPVITEGGTLYLSCLRNPTQRDTLRWMTTAEVHALEVKSGSHRWITSIRGVECSTGNVSVHPLLTSPVPGLDGTLYIGAEMTEQVPHDSHMQQDPLTHSCLIALRAHHQLATSAAWPIENGNASGSGISPLHPR